MSRIATDADFNIVSRYLDVRIDIYFTSTPLTVSKSDYLIDANWLEEGSAESSNPFGAISSNELSFRLFNSDGIFSPTNSVSPYFGNIKAGVPVELFIRPIYDNDEVDWIQLGRYYVTGWEAQITGTYADVVANDEWYNIFNSPMPNYPITRDITYHDFMSDFFDLLNVVVSLDECLTGTLPFAFVSDSIKDFLQELSAAALGYVTSGKDGTPLIGSFMGNKPVRATLTDDDQIRTVSTKQSIIRAYDGVELTYSVPQISAVTSLVELAGVVLSQGTNEISNIAFSSSPLWQVSMIDIKSNSDVVSLRNFEATQGLISLLLECAVEAIEADLAVYGKTIGLTEFTLSDEATKQLSISNKYIQSSSYAEYYKSILNAFVNNNVALLTLSVRGNPLLNVGDKVIVSSTKYNLNYTGIIQRMNYSYAGGLLCDMTLLNAEILEGAGV
jgi:hypothetical protein